MVDSLPLTRLDARLENSAVFTSKLINVIVSRNAFDVGDRCLLYGLPAMMNHSCGAKQTTAHILAKLGDAMLVRAERDINAGEELFHSYFPVSGSVRTRRSRSAAMDFECACERCSFECRLQGTAAAAVTTAASDEFATRLQPKLLGLGSLDSSALRTDDVESADRHWALLQDIQQTLRSVSVYYDPNWADKEVGWYLHLVLPLSTAGLWCCHVCYKSRGTEYDRASLLTVRCELLFQVVLAWEHTDLHGYDHLKNIHLLLANLNELDSCSANDLMAWKCTLRNTLAIAMEKSEHHKLDGDRWEVVDIRDLIASTTERCELAYCRRFGVDRHFLGLGTSCSRAAGLLQTLKL